MSVEEYVNLGKKRIPALKINRTEIESVFLMESRDFMSNPSQIPQQNLLLNDCLKSIEQKLGWLKSEEWRHSHFELLSERIFEETKVRLSSATLKRLWGKISYQSSPSMTTLDALAQFLGFENWIGYELDARKTQNLTSAEPIEPGFPSSFPFKQLLLVAGLILIVACSTIISWPKGKRFLLNDDIVFDFESVVHGVPNTVKFTYDVSNTAADSVFIQQSWDPRLRHKVNKDEGFHAVTYYYPGFFNAKLILNDQIVAEKDLIIHSNGWLGTIQKSPVPFYLRGEEITNTGFLEINSDQLVERGFDLNQELPYSNLNLIKEFDKVRANDLKLTTSFKNTSGNNSGICQKTRILLLCNNGIFILPFSIKGCVGELYLTVPGKKIAGQKRDLSGFGVDFSDWVNLDVSTKGNQLVIKINGKEILSETLSVDPGKLVGIRYQFHGTGAVKSLKIKSGGEVRYEDNFQKPL